VSEQASRQDGPATPLEPPTVALGSSQNRPALPLRTLGLVAMCLGVAALAAAAFALSYSGIRTVAIDAGISARHAGDYPVLIDAMLVIALLAVLGLRGAGLPSRILAWLALLAVLAAGAGADVQYATGHTFRHTVGAAIAAALPWALVFIAFVLLLALLRHARLRHQASVARRRTELATDARTAVADQSAATLPTSLPVRTPRPRDSASIVPGFSARLVSSAAAGAAAAAAEQPGPAPAAKAADHHPREADPSLDDTNLGSAGAEDTGAGALAEPAGAAAEPDDPPAEPAEAAAEPDDPPAEPAGVAAEPDDPPAEPAGAAAEPDDPPAELGDAGTTQADAGGAETIPPTVESDDPTAGDPAATDPAATDPAATDPATTDQGAYDDLPDNMPVFHRMWNTPTPPEN
jgi:hypothetical protein